MFILLALFNQPDHPSVVAGRQNRRGPWASGCLHVQFTFAFPETRDFKVGERVAAAAIGDEFGRRDRGAHQAASLMTVRAEKTMADLVSQHAAERTTHVRRRRVAATNRVIQLVGVQRPDEPPGRSVVEMNGRTRRCREAAHPVLPNVSGRAAERGGNPSFT